MIAPCLISLPAIILSQVDALLTVTEASAKRLVVLQDSNQISSIHADYCRLHLISSTNTLVEMIAAFSMMPEYPLMAVPEAEAKVSPSFLNDECDMICCADGIYFSIPQSFRCRCQ